MTNHKGTSSNEEELFQVVLVDMKKLVEGEVHCVEKPLMGSGDLKYVAISYRWGELNETLVDTGLGYIASITSFALLTLAILCKTMTQERDLKHMDYIWVDAICVDQTNYERRKATIYHMTDIYERANYIVAVPDLHLEHVKTTSELIRQTIDMNRMNAAYIYHLIQGNVAQLEAYDQQFLDKCKVPNDPHLRYLLIKYTNHFSNGFVKCQYDSVLDNEAEVLQHLLPTYSHHHGGKISQNQSLNGVNNKKPTMDLDKLTIDELHTCNDMEKCPLKHDNDEALDKIKKAWIPKRSQQVRQGMACLAGLITDWSTRAWVVSEYHIAKNKSNKMKYWFMQLDSLYSDPENFDLDQYSFFEFDFNDDANQDECPVKNVHHPNAVYQVFHSTMQEQLNQQTFLEKMLKTKASKNGKSFNQM